jgi:concentrative nucleoside transporter, CNT family
MSAQLMSFLGLGAIIAIAYLLCPNKKQVKWRVVFWGVVFQLVFGLLILKTQPGRWFFDGMNNGVVQLLNFQEEGAKFVFGSLGISQGNEGSMGFFFAFQALTTIIFFSALISLLYYFRIMQVVIMFFAKIMKFFMKTSGAETLTASASIFIGQAETPLIVAPYLKTMTRSELLTVMVSCMATVSGGIMGLYVGMLHNTFPDIGGHLLAASVMSAPAAILLSKLLLPETEVPVTGDEMVISSDNNATNAIEAVVLGAESGLKIALNVGAVLLVFMGLIALFNSLFSSCFAFIGLEGITIQSVLGYMFSPLAWIMGIPTQDCLAVGQLLGEKTVFNEVVAYGHLGEILKENPEALSQRAIIITSYALCGFANFMSIGIQVGGMGVIAPNRKKEIAKLGIKALIGGTLAACMTGAVVGIFI